MDKVDTIDTTVDIAANLATVKEQIATAADRAGRSAEEITLVAVSKTKPMTMIESALQAGQVDFGENRFEDVWQKIKQAESAGLSEIQWHFIGTIQSRKTSQAVGPFVLVHSVDRMRIATRLSRDAEAVGNVMSVLLEVNVSGEESKHGFQPDELLETVPELAALPGIEIKGLMTMAPFVDDPEQTRPVFRGLRTLREQLISRYPEVDWQHLSMGMTNDFEVAIEEGATIVRIGSAIFGARNY